MPAPLRITKPPATGDDAKYYLARLVKLIPSEVISLYMVGAGILDNSSASLYRVWILICLLAVIVVRTYGTSDTSTGKQPDLIHVAISFFSFVIWVYWLPSPGIPMGWHNPKIAALLVVIWTFFIPFFYKGEAE